MFLTGSPEVDLEEFTTGRVYNHPAQYTKNKIKHSNKRLDPLITVPLLPLVPFNEFKKNKILMYKIIITLFGFTVLKFGVKQSPLI